MNRFYDLQEDEIIINTLLLLFLNNNLPHDK